MTALLVAEGLAILILGVLVVGLLRSHADILRSLHQLGAGVLDDHDHPRPPAPAPRLNANAPADVSGETLHGSAVHIGVSGTDTRTLLAFLSSGCSSCVALWHDLAADPTAGMADTRLVVVTKSPADESRSRLIELAPPGVTVVQTTQAWFDYGVPVTPYFVLVDGLRGDIVGEGSAASWGQVRSLIVQAQADRETLGTTDGEMPADAELRRSGIGPGHPSLYPDRPPVEESS
ncbi:MAG: hypothetical protein L0Z49_03655 [Actinobacteria bacterium]|nr:hypothetical protein [Actinomycetota bacterium]